MHTIARMTDGRYEIREGRDDDFVIANANDIQVLTITTLLEEDLAALQVAETKDAVNTVLANYLP